MERQIQRGSSRREIGCSLLFPIDLIAAALGANLAIVYNVLVCMESVDDVCDCLAHNSTLKMTE